MQSYTDYQSDDTPTFLTIGEIWALPVMLRLCVIQCLTQAACRLTGTTCEGSLPGIPLPTELKDDQTVANAILSLRALAAEDWKAFFENVSQVEHILRSDPARYYAAMDTDTRDRYRKVIERLARATGKDEPDIARMAIALAQKGLDGNAKEAGSVTPRLAHVGYYLIDEGRLLLEMELSYPAPAQVRFRRWARHHPTFVYLGSISLISVPVLLAVLGLVFRDGARPLQLAVAFLLSIIPALSIAVGLTNWLVTLALPPRILPKMDFAHGVPPEYKTLIVIPALFGSASEVNSLLKQIELHYLRNTDANLSFALLTDFSDAPQQHMPADDSLIKQATNGILVLNRKYPRETAAPFYILHRERRWNTKQARWMGWERKRGKLQELNHLLRGGTDTSYNVQVGDLNALSTIKYVNYTGCRHHSAERRGTAAGGNACTSAKPCRIQRNRAYHRGLYDIATTHRDHASQRRALSFHAHICRRRRARSLHACRFGRVPGPVWDWHLHRQRNIRCGRLRALLKGPYPRKYAAQP